MVQQNTTTIAERLDAELASANEGIERMDGEIAALTRDNDDEGGAARNHMGDEGSNDYELQRLMSVQEELRARIALIETARQRLDDGTYGICQRCGNPIPEARLDAIPFALFDVECQEIVDDQANPALGFTNEARTGDGVNG
jgi:DnaK suppressor protein